MLWVLAIVFFLISTLFFLISIGKSENKSVIIYVEKDLIILKTHTFKQKLDTSLHTSIYLLKNSNDSQKCKQNLPARDIHCVYHIFLSGFTSDVQKAVPDAKSTNIANL